MRKTVPVLDALFPQIRKSILSTTLLRPDKWWYLSELARYLGTSPSSLQREVRSLAASGILEHRRDASRAYYRAETNSPYFRELRRLLQKTHGIVPTLRSGLKRLAGEIKSAFVFGSIARGEEDLSSDVDLMVIGRSGLAELSPRLRELERKLERDINVISYSVQEFRRCRSHGDHFLTSVLEGPKEFIVGGQNELDSLAGKTPGGTARHLKK